MSKMFNQLRNVELSHQLGFVNQENIQIQMSNFSKNFDVLLIQNVAHNVAANDKDDDANPLDLNVLMFVSQEKMIDIKDCKDLLKDIVTAAIEKKQFETMINMNIPMLKSGYILIIVEKLDSQKSVNRDCYLDVENVDNNLMTIREILMAIFKVVYNLIDHDEESYSLEKIGDNDNTNSNNKKLTNNCKIYINNDNINFSYNCDDEYYKIIFNDASVFLSVKPIDIDNIGSITKLMIMTMNEDDYMMNIKTMNMMYQLQSHLIKSFIVNEMVKINDKTSTTSQSNTNKSEYAFERTLNNFKYAEDDDDYNDDDANVANNNYNIDKSSFKSMIQLIMNMDSIPKLFFFIQRWCSFKCMMMRIIDDDIYAGRKIDDDNDDAGYMMIISEQMMQLQSFNESDQQSGIVSNNSSNDNSITTKLIISDKNNFDKDGESEDFEILISNKNGDTDVDQSKMMKKPMNTDVDIGGSEYSHRDDQIGKSLIVVNADDTVNITCDFNYLNYKIKNKINDQNRMDEISFKEDKIFNEKLKINNSTTSTNNTSSLVNKKTTINIDELIECQQNEKSMDIDRHSLRMRLVGGGEGSLSGASGWGSPPTANPPVNNNNPGAAQWGAPAQQAPQQPWNQPPGQGGAASSQAQQGNPNVPGQQQNAPGQNPNQKPLTPGNQSVGWNQQPPPQNQPPPPNQIQPQVVPQQGNGGQGAGNAKVQLEQLNSMREALFAQDGWGCQNVNQDTNWDVPGSPEPSPRNPTGDPSAQPGAWKPQHLNNGTELWEANLRNGGQPAPQPIQKTPWQGPANPIGGTWGEDDDSQGDVWPGNQPQQAPGWNQPPSNPNSNSNASSMWPNTPGGVGVNANIPKKENDWGNVPGANSGWGNPSSGTPMMDPRDPRASGVDMRMMESREMQGNVRGVTGRLNGSSDMWSSHPQIGSQQGQNINKIVGPGAAAVNNPGQWPAGPQGVAPKDHDMAKPSGWGESSPPTVRRSMADDGTSLWGSRAPEANWKGVPNNFPGNRNPMAPGNSNFPPNRLPGAGMKQDANWSGLHSGGTRAAWEDQHGTPNWEDKPHMGWNENQNSNINPMWNTKKQWPEGGDVTSEWPQPNKMGNASTEIIRNSKHFRILVENGFKKDDVELALRNTNMNIDEAMELLQQQQRNNAGIDPWPHGGGGSGGFDHSPFPGNNRFPGPQTMQFPPNNSKLPNPNSTGPSANLGGLQMPLNKHLPHSAGNPAFTPQPAASQGGAGGNPSTHHLRNLVQQIQKAVQAGYLNHQILNQPLAPQTLQLLNTLLTTIQQLQFTQQNIPRNGGVNNIQLQMTIQKHKQTITTLQAQIAQQQSLYLKNGMGNDFIRPNNVGMGGGNHNDPIVPLDNSLAGLNLGNKEPTTPYTSNPTSQQSRLNQWKLPSALDNKSTDPDFSRAPGSTSKQSLPPTTPTSISSIGMHNEASTWSSGRNDPGGWPEPEPENKDWPSNNQSPAFTDLVPEFQPGKPWKGTQKNIEDDPTITPGSVARSLSISATKEPDLFGSNTAKTSPNEILSSSTWSFNPSTTTQQNFSSTMPKLGADQAKSTWSDSTSDLWSSSSISKSTGPPPGLGASKNGATPSTGEANWMDGWNSTSSSFSTWLLLKNLTTQIDGSTLRTLCVQHGPLQNFHLYLNHGIALCKYNTREEAGKAQQALNNCVLSNTTICAESPSESEVQNILQHLGVPGSQGNGGNGGNGGNNQNPASTVANPSTWRPPSQQGPARTAGTDSTWGADWPATNSAINW